MTALRGFRVPAVEDEPMRSLALQDMPADLGRDAVGMAPPLESALELARELDFDIAVLDINLGGERVDPVAEVVVSRWLPIVFLAGYGRAGAPQHVPGPVVEKPYAPANPDQALSQSSRTLHG